MKIRTGFVSNSSSSSFICEVSGEVVSGWDMGLDEAEMYQCDYGHTFSREYAVCGFTELPMEVKRELALDSISENYDIDDREEREADYLIRKQKALKELTDEAVDEMIENDEFNDEVQYGYGVPAEMCPICQFTHVTDNDAKRFMLKKLNISEEGLKTSIKNLFDSYEKLQTYLLTVKE